LARSSATRGRAGVTCQWDGSRWVHPAATGLFSATITHGKLFVHSTSTAFTPTAPGDPHGYTKFKAYALLEHNGDSSAAVKVVIEMGAPTWFNKELGSQLLREIEASDARK
jgi:hypothetical protein